MSNFPHNDIFSNLPPLRDVISAHDLRAEKKLGQNFLLDQNITDKIVRCAGDLSGVHVFEIGPGPGGLTRSILKTGARKVTAIEFDPRAVGALQDLKDVAMERLDVIAGDALGTDLTSFGDGPRAIIANLPYNIATPLLVGWLKQIYADPDTYSSMYLMFQREVADRVSAKVGDKAYGRLAVLSSWLCDVKRVVKLPPNAFIPPPKVHSAVVEFKSRVQADDIPAFEVVEALTAAAFGQRRKMLRSSLKDYAGAMEVCGVDQTKRAEELAPEEFIKLAKHV